MVGVTWLVYVWRNAALRWNDAGTMISVVMSLMWFVVKWCICCCVLFVFSNVAQGVLSQVLFSVACCVKCSLKRSSISSIVLDGELVQLGFSSMLKDELV